MIKEIQDYLKQKQIQFYIIPTDDDHQSEYVGEHYQLRKYLSGFTGSNGLLLIGQNEAYLWTDGRYFIQAEKQLPSDIQLMKINTPGYPSFSEFMIKHLNENDTIAFDKTCMQAYQILSILDEIDFDIEIIHIDSNTFWENQPERSHQEVYVYDIKYHGESTLSKLDRIRNEMKQVNCDSHLIASLDDIAWIFNIRGSDIDYNPVALAFAIVELDKATLYLQDDTYHQDFINQMKQDNIEIKNYYFIYQDVSKLSGTILLDLTKINYKLYESIQTNFYFNTNPSQYMKAIKNEVEINNTKKAHLKDGIAVTKFMYWLKHTDEHLDELSVEAKLQSFRKAQGCLDDSFRTIAAYKKHGAIIHYAATKESNIPIEKKGLLTIDSGGQYLEGTTDITRTFVMGDLTDIERRDFTLVLKGFLALMNAQFIEGTSGQNLDILARQYLHRYGLDFRHGTGHGIGHFLNVHEGPQSIRPHAFQEEIAIKPGMITSNEPGVYIENSHGLRHENELLCIQIQQTEFGNFLGFESLTLVPIDIEGIDLSLFTQEDKAILNQYHKQVYEKLSNYLTDNEKAWLKQITQAM